MIGYAFCGSFCTFSRSFEVLQSLVLRGFDVQPIMSETAYSTDTRFWRADEFRERVEAICSRKIIHTITEAEPLGPKTPLEAMIIAPCTGNTLAKLAWGVTDSCVTLAAKAHLRNARPLIIAPSTNDALANAAKNIGALFNYKNIYFVPYGQDSFAGKPNSMVADFSLIPDTLQHALNGTQVQPVILTPK